jgi:hypothetical protein
MAAARQTGAVVADEGFTAFFQGAYPRVVGQLRPLTGVLGAAEDAAYGPAADRWLAIPGEPDVRAVPPVRAGGAAPALLRLRYQATGAVRVWVRVPAR